jgi:hypothetical protein
VQWTGMAGPDYRRDSNRKSIFEYQLNLDLARLGENLRGDLEGIWTWGFFLNSSRLLKDF